MEYTLREEIANAITHGIGAALSIAALVLLLVFSIQYGDVWHIVSFTIYGTSLILLYTFSTLLHAIQNIRAKNIFEILDHSAIYLLIAGTYTPFLLVTIRGPLGWTLFGIVWGMALIGIVLKIFWVKRFIILSTLFYIFMGWLILFAIKPLYQNMEFSGLVWLFIGGVFYTVGCVFYVWRGFPFHHAVWHMFVLFGSIAHFFAVLHVLPV